MDTRIPLMVQPIDFVGSMAAGNQLAAQTNQLRDQNALRDVYRTQGAGLVAGDGRAINALAAIDPQAALGIRDAQMNMEARQLDMQATRQRMEMLTREEQRAIADAARTMDEQEKAAALEEAKREVFRIIAAPTPEIFDQMVTEAGKPELRGQWANRQMLGADYVSSVEEAMKLSAGPDQSTLTDGAPAGYMWADPNNRALGVKPLPGVVDKPQAPYTAQGKLRADLNAGKISQSEFEAGMAALAPKGTTLEVLPGGGVRFTDNVAGGGAAGQTVGDVYKPGTTDQAIELIDQIANSPALERITGPYMGGGGNNIDDLNMFQRGIYRAEGLDTIEKINQLQSQAWMAARAMLKGGGQITDYESKKAEAAVARLSRAKGAEEFRAALKDLRDAITEGEAKLRAAQGGQAATPTTPQTPATETLSDEELMQQLLGGN